MNMTCDIYVQKNTQLPSGSFERMWEYKKTISCKIEPISQKGAGVSGDGESFGKGVDGFIDSLQLKMKTLEYLSKRQRVSLIKSNDGQSMFLEVDKMGQDDTIFDVVSSHPVLDPFGKISHYSVNLRRASIQNNDTVQN